MSISVETAAEWSAEDTTISEVVDKLTELRATEAAPLRTAVLTHIAWIPPEWTEAALDTLAGMHERHPSRAILLLSHPDAGSDGIDAEVELRTFDLHGVGRSVGAEVITLRLRGDRCVAPASVVWPLVIPDLPVFLRWRGRPPFGEEPLEQLVDFVHRLIVDSTEWPDLPAAYAELAQLFDRTAVSDIAWARTSRWRAQLASLWPGIGEARRIRVQGTLAQAWLLVGWLRARLGRDIELEHVPSERLVGVEVDGEPAPFPPGDAPPPSDLLSEQLDQFGRDTVYEAAVRAAAPRGV
jgi:hypothetical protein